MEDNFALAVFVFIIGFSATLATAITIFIAHRRSEREFYGDEEVGA